MINGFWLELLVHLIRPFDALEEIDKALVNILKQPANWTVALALQPAQAVVQLILLHLEIAAVVGTTEMLRCGALDAELKHVCIIGLLAQLRAR